MKYITIILLLTSNYVIAQVTNSSPYSIYGLGIINETYSGANRALGGTGIGVRDPLNLNFLNPAAYTSVAPPSTSIFSLGVGIENVHYETNEHSASRMNGGMNNLSLWFRPHPRWASLIGLTPLSSVSYNISTKRTVAGTENNYNFSGSGNTNKIYWGNGFNITKNLYTGINIGFLFGSVNRKESIVGGNSADAISLNNRIHARKFTIDYGLQYKFDLGKNKTLVSGLTYDNGVTLYGNSQITLYQGQADTLKTYTGNSVRYTLPRNVGFGLSLNLRKSIIAADVKFSEWSKGGYSNRKGILRDTWRISGGYQYFGEPESESMFKRLRLSAGGYIQDFYMKLNETVLPVYGFALGLGLPLQDGRSTLSLTYNYERFGSVENQLILQQSSIFSLDLTIRDIWGIRRKFD